MSYSGPITWRRVTKRTPCPICGKADWCSIADDESVACCMRIEAGAVRHKDLGHGEGHFHKIGTRDSGLGARDPGSHYRAPSPRPRAPIHDVDFDAIIRAWRGMACDFKAFANQLNVAADALARLDAAWSPAHNAWAFPMHDDRRTVIGIRLRSTTGRKWAVVGSKSGLFIPADLDSRSMLLICEGPTDVAAALTLGFQVVGRPSCSGGTEILCDMLQAGRRRDVVIVADADGPGRAGARRLADRILGLCRTVRIISSAPHKDIRAWLGAGATAQVVQVRIDNSRYQVASGLDQNQK